MAWLRVKSPRCGGKAPVLGTICGSGGAFGTRVTCSMNWQPKTEVTSVGYKGHFRRSLPVYVGFRWLHFIKVHGVHPMQIIFLWWMGSPKWKVWRKEDGWSFFNVKADINTSPPNPSHRVIFSARHRLLQSLCSSLWSFPLIAITEEAGLSLRISAALKCSSSKDTHTIR